MDSLQCPGQVSPVSALKEMPDRFDGAESHPRRRAGSEDAVDKLFPESLV
ncbi:MAG: hypothetical protein QOJ64_2604 [Acidobacteriota bacterium]|nr:hypothetical protein [Acidobacteriota bacterium]